MTDVASTPRGSMSQTRRLRIWEAHGGICCLCKLKIDGVRERWGIEHLRALALGGADSDDNCGPAHERCMLTKTQADIPAIAKAKRIKAKHLGIRKPSRWPTGRDSKWKSKIGGGTVLRVTD